jgi:hypothetical protein
MCVHMCSYVYMCVHMCSYVYMCVHMCSYVFICQSSHKVNSKMLKTSSYFPQCMYIKRCIWSNIHTYIVAWTEGCHSQAILSWPQNVFFLIIYFLKYTQWQCKLSFWQQHCNEPMCKDLKTLHNAGFKLGIFCSEGGRDDHYATPPPGWPQNVNISFGSISSETVLGFRTKLLSN